MRRATFLLALLGVLSCTGEDLGEHLTGHHLADLEFPLFPDGTEAEYARLRQARMAAGKPDTTLTEDIAWATELDEAFARATWEDKPVLIATFVRENGDPHCDV